MSILSRSLVTATLFSLLILPLSASALGVSFGGRITAVLPCMSALGPSLHTTILAARTIPHFEFYIWTPATKTKLVGPPTPGGQILGVADIPYVCFTFNPISCGFFGLFSCLVPVPFYGLRMQYIGTSFPGPASAIIPGGGSFGGGGSSAGF